MTDPVEFVTARLRLCRPEPQDAADVFERYASGPEVTRSLGLIEGLAAE